MNRIFKYALMFAFVGIAMFALSQMSDGAKGADITWDGGGADNLADNPLNWVGDNNPVAGDTVIFNSTSSKDCEWRDTFEFAILRVYSTYTGNLSSNYAIQGASKIIEGNIYLGPNGTLIIPQYWGNTITGSGSINGPGTAFIRLYDSDETLNFDGYINNLKIVAYPGAPSSHILSLSDDLNAGTIIIEGETTRTCTFNLNGKTLTASTITIGTRGIVLGGDGVINCSGNWDDTNGTFTPETGNVILSGTGYCHTDDPGTFYNLQLEGTTRFVHAISTTAFTANGQWTGRVYYNGTADVSTDQQHWTGWLYTQNDIAIEYNSYAYLEFNHDALLGIQLESWSGTDNFTWNATSVASQTVVWSWSRGESSSMYDEYMDTIYIGSDETNAGGMGTFTSTFVGSHAFLLSRSTFLPASTDIDDSVWLGILFMCIATIINFVGYVRKIGLLQIVSFLVLLVGIFAATDVWEELWTLPTLFILTNAVIFIIGMMRRG